MAIPEDGVLDDRFHPGEMLQASELASKSFSDLEKVLHEHRKLLITHHARPAAVLVDWEAFEALVRWVQELEELAEEAEIQKLVAARPADAPEAWAGRVDYDRAWDVLKG